MRIVSVLLSTVLFLFFPGLCPPAVAGEPGLWQYVQPEAQFLVGLDWTRARNSATVRMLLERLRKQSPQLAPAQTALDALNMVEHALVSGSVPEGGTAQPDVVVALEGRFDRAALKRLMPPGTASERFKGCDLLVPPRSRAGDMLLALVSDRLAVVGVRAELARILAAPAPLKDAALVARATLLASEYDVWVASGVAPARAAAVLAPQVKGFEEIESVDVGISLQRGLALNARVTAHSADDAKALATFAQLGLAMAGQGKGQPAEVAALLKSVSFKTEGRVVHAGFDFTLAQIERGLSGLRTQVAAVAVPRKVRAAEPVQPVRRSIRIVGAEGGEREIPYSALQR